MARAARSRRDAASASGAWLLAASAASLAGAAAAAASATGSAQGTDVRLGGVVKVLSVEEQLGAALSTVVEICAYAQAAGARVASLSVAPSPGVGESVLYATEALHAGAPRLVDLFPGMVDVGGGFVDTAGTHKEVAAACPDGFQLWTLKTDPPHVPRLLREAWNSSHNASLGRREIQSCDDLEEAMRGPTCGALLSWRGIKRGPCAKYCRLPCEESKRLPAGAGDRISYTLSPAFLARVAAARSELFGDGGAGVDGVSAQGHSSDLPRAYVGLHLRSEKICARLVQMRVQGEERRCAELVKVVERAVAALASNARASNASIAYVASDMNAVHGTMSAQTWWSDVKGFEGKIKPLSAPAAAKGPCGFRQGKCMDRVVREIADSGLRIVGLAGDSVCGEKHNFMGTECVLAEMGMLSQAAFVAALGQSSLHGKFLPQHSTIFKVRQSDLKARESAGGDRGWTHAL